MTRRLLLGSFAVGAAQVAVVTLLARLVGFGRWGVFESTVGSGAVGSAYTSANAVPNVLFEVVAGGALVVAVVPLLAGPVTSAAAGRAAVDRTASAALTWAGTVLVPCAAVLALCAAPIARALLDDPSPEQLALATRLLVVFSPQVVLYGIGVVLTGVLHAHRRFLAAALAPLASSLVVVTAYALFAVVGGDGRGDPATLGAAAEAVLGWGTTAGVAALTLPLLVPVLRSGVRLRPTWSFPPGVAARARRLAGAGLVALVAQQVSVVAVLRAANAVEPTGGFPVYLYAQAVQLLPYGVLVVPLATVAFPRLAAAAARGDHESYARTVALTTRAVVLAAAAGAAAVAASAPAVGAVFRALSPAPAPALGSLPGLLTAMAPGVVGLAVSAHVSRALYALDRGRAAGGWLAAGWLLVAALAAVAPSVGAAAGGAGGVAGGSTTRAMVWLGVATSTGTLAAATGLVLSLRRAAGAGALAGVPRSLAVAMAGAVVAAVAARWLGGPAALGAVLGGAGLGGAVLAAVLAAGLTAALAVLTLLAVVAVADRASLTQALALVRGRAATPGSRAGVAR